MNKVSKVPNDVSEVSEVSKVSIDHIRSFKDRQPLPVLTAYDYPMARLLDELKMPIILVGDSLGMVVLGHSDTTRVSMSDMEHHVRAVARAKPKSLIVADLPFGSYQTPEEALKNSMRLCEAGAEAIKAEGASDISQQIRTIIESGIPFMGHIGMLPQHIRKEGRYRIKGRTQSEAAFLREEAKVLNRLGAFAVVLELVDHDVAKCITQSESLLTIGIGSGSKCDGQILVVNDLIGTFPWFCPSFVKPKMNGAAEMKKAIEAWKNEVRDPESQKRSESKLQTSQTSESTSQTSESELQRSSQTFSQTFSQKKDISRLTHIDEKGETSMIDVSSKPISDRFAKAIGRIYLTEKTIDLIESNSISKGNVLTTARLAGILAAKRTAELIPLAHLLPISHCDVSFKIPASRDRIDLIASARISAQTGVEMEALTAVSVAALTIYDMCKAHDKSMCIGEIRLSSKTKTSV